MAIHNLINCKDLSTAIGPYSHASIVKNLGVATLYTSGQIGVDKDGDFVGDDIISQSQQVLKNLTLLLETNGFSLNDVVKTTCFLTTMNNFADFNSVYASYFTENKPARSTVAVAQLPKNALVEVELIAIRSV